MTKDEERQVLQALDGLFSKDGEPGGVAVWSLGGSYAVRSAISIMQAEIAKPEPSAVRNAGAQLSKVAFNWAQKCGYTLTSDDCSMLDKLRKEWDAAAKSHTDQQEGEPSGNAG